MRNGWKTSNLRCPILPFFSSEGWETTNPPPPTHPKSAKKPTPSHPPSHPLKPSSAPSGPRPNSRNQSIFHNINCPVTHAKTILWKTARFLLTRDNRCCQSYFRGASIRHSSPGTPGKSTRSLAFYAGVSSPTELHQPAALIGARARSVSSWHGMPTASVKNLLSLN
jgi:hypothetical protein